jgi:hypothetical protein
MFAKPAWRLSAESRTCYCFEFAAPGFSPAREKRDATMASVRRGRGPFWFYFF